MARKQDDLSLDEELAAAFLDNGSDISVDDGEMVDAPIDTQIDEAVEEEDVIIDPNAGEDDWDDSDDIPGQLAVDVYETADRLVIKARTAGIEKQDLNVEIKDNILTISGILNSSDDDKATQWHIQECYWGEFSRTIALPVQVKEEDIEAVLKDGILTISFKKEEAETTRRILIQ